MKVSQISQNFITPKTTGYAATTALTVSVLSGISKNKSFRKTHKPFAYMAALFTAFHFGLIEYYHHKYKKM